MLSLPAAITSTSSSPSSLPPAHVPVSASLIEAFVNEENIPFISAFDSHNFKTLAATGRTLAMLVVDYASPRNDVLQSALLLAATEMERVGDENAAVEDKDYLFGHVNGLRWTAFLKQYGVTTAPAFLILTKRNITVCLLLRLWCRTMTWSRLWWRL